MKQYLSLIIALLLLAACGQPKAKYVIGVSQCSQDNWRDKLTRSANPRGAVGLRPPLVS